METIINGFKTNRAFAVTSVLVLVLIAIAFAAPVLAPYDPTHATMQDAFMAPGGSHLFGTDKCALWCACFPERCIVPCSQRIYRWYFYGCYFRLFRR